MPAAKDHTVTPRKLTPAGANKSALKANRSNTPGRSSTSTRDDGKASKSVERPKVQELSSATIENDEEDGTSITSASSTVSAQEVPTNNESNDAAQQSPSVRSNSSPSNAKEADTSSESGGSTSSDASDTESDTIPSVQKLVKERKETHRQNLAQAGNLQAYNDTFSLPSGFSVSTNIPTRESLAQADLLKADNLNGKEVWCIDSPFPLTSQALQSISHVDLQGLTTSTPIVLTHKHNTYVLTATHSQEQTATQQIILLPTREGKYKSAKQKISRTFSVQRQLDLPQHIRAPSLSRPTQGPQAHNVQPAGLRMRWQAFGLPPHPSSLIASQSSSSDSSSGSEGEDNGIADTTYTNSKLTLPPRRSFDPPAQASPAKKRKRPQVTDKTDSPTNLTDTRDTTPQPKEKKVKNSVSKAKTKLPERPK